MSASSAGRSFENSSGRRTSSNDWQMRSSARRSAVTRYSQKRSSAASSASSRYQAHGTSFRVRSHDTTAVVLPKPAGDTTAVSGQDVALASFSVTAGRSTTCAARDGTMTFDGSSTMARMSAAGSLTPMFSPFAPPPVGGAVHPQAIYCSKPARARSTARASARPNTDTGKSTHPLRVRPTSRPPHQRSTSSTVKTAASSAGMPEARSMSTSALAVHSEQA